MQPLEYAKQFIAVRHVKSCAVVPDEIDLLPVSAVLTSYFNPCSFLFTAVFPGVAQQVLYNHKKQQGISRNHKPVLYLDLHLAFRLLFPEFPLNTPGNF